MAVMQTARKTGLDPREVKAQIRCLHDAAARGPGPRPQREGGDPLVFEVVSGAVAAFPDALQVPRLKVNMVAAAGHAAGAGPQIRTSMRCAIGQQGEGRDPQDDDATD